MSTAFEDFDAQVGVDMPGAGKSAVQSSAAPDGTAAESSAAAAASVSPREAPRNHAGKTRVKRILLVDDVPEIHKLIAVQLQSLPVELIHANNGKLGLDLAAQHQPDLILLDQEMPEQTGMETLKSIRSDAALARIPVIMVTSTADLASVSEAFSLGAVDYLRKPFCAVELRARVGAALRTQALLKKLQEQALHDNLTGLPNRHLLTDQLATVLSAHKANPSMNYAVLYVDFDRFKAINDTLGHEIGDNLLREIAARFRANLRLHDAVGPSAAINRTTVARVGGDEFVVLLAGLKRPTDGRNVADRLLRAFSEPYRIGDHDVHTSASIGMVTSEIVHERVDDLLRDADMAMYEAKARGRSCTAEFDSSMRERARRRIVMERDLRKALDRGQFQLVYQPVFSLNGGHISSVEALLRWQHPDFGLLPPATFLSIAEESGLIVPIGEWVIREACDQLGEWRTLLDDKAPASMSVNISLQQIQGRTVTGMFMDTLQAAGLSPHELILELSERELMRNPELSTRSVQALADAGLRIAMDDFGTSYSSLTCLRQFPLSIAKLASSFVTDIGSSRDLVAVLNAMIELAHDLGIETVAEGVESTNQLVTLQALGCNYAQGYCLSRPLPPRAFFNLCSGGPAGQLAALPDAGYEQ